ncbi:MAG TPA: hypothetical protein VMJ10_31420 [Kofleriaceae bacterium]|nr:hypothetical protein [Kofleriaceae bacterium]
MRHYIVLALAACSSSSAEPTPKPAPDVALAPPPKVAPAPKAAPAPQQASVSYESNPMPATPIEVIKWLVHDPSQWVDHDTLPFVVIDYSAKPQGGYNSLESMKCPGYPGHSELAAYLDRSTAQLGAALADGRVHCAHRGHYDFCDVPAGDQGEATLTYVLAMRPSPRVLAFMMRDTFMIADEAKLASDRARQDRTVTHLIETANCGPRSEIDDESHRQRSELMESPAHP